MGLDLDRGREMKFVKRDEYLKGVVDTVRMDGRRSFYFYSILLSLMLLRINWSIL